MNAKKITSFILLLSVAAAPVWADTVVIEDSFIANTPASAAQINGKFAEYGNAINDNDARIDANLQNMPGLNFIESGSLPTVNIISGAFTMVSNITVTAPAAGYLVATAYGRHNCTVPGDFIRVEFLNTTTTESSIEYLDDPISSSGFRSISFSSHFAVGAVANNIEFRARCNSGTGQINMRSFYVMYLPNRYQ